MDDDLQVLWDLLDRLAAIGRERRLRAAAADGEGDDDE